MMNRVDSIPPEKIAMQGDLPEALARGSSMEKQAQNIQEAFLNNARKDKTLVLRSSAVSYLPPQKRQYPQALGNF